MESIFPNFLKICTLDQLQNNRNYIIWRFIKLMSQPLNFSYELVTSVDGYLGHRLPDGNVSGIFGMMERGECDISFDTFAVTEARRQAADFSFPYHFTDITFLTHKPRLQVKSFAIFHPFSVSVWVALVAFLLVKALLFFAVLRKTRTYTHVLMIFFGNLMHEPIPYNLKKSSSKLLMASWIIGVFFVTASYQATLLSFLTIPSYVGIRNIKELTEAVTVGSVECMTLKGSFLTNYFLGLPDDSAKAVGWCLKVNEAKRMDAEEFLDHYTSSGVYITARTNVRPLEVKYYLSEDSYFTVIVAVAIPKKFCCKKRLDKVVKMINEAYLYEKIVDDVIYNSSLKKHAAVKEIDYNKTIALEDVSGSFLILAVGYALGFAALCFELRFKCKNKSRITSGLDPQSS